MTDIWARIVADSIQAGGSERAYPRLVTLQLRYPKSIHGELMTHRELSRNARSSRAVPVKRILQEVRDDPAMPVAWLANQKGMQGGGELGPDERSIAETGWRAAATAAADHAERLLDDAGLHKQWVNRITEPFVHIDTLVSTVRLANLRALRCHPAAQPEFRMLAEAIFDAIADSRPRELGRCDWHVPYITAAEYARYWETHASPQDRVDNIPWGLLFASATRAARISYRPFDPREGQDLATAIEKGRELAAARPVHASPFEHQACVDELWFHADYRLLHGNLTGFIQLRKLLDDERVYDEWASDERDSWRMQRHGFLSERKAGADRAGWPSDVLRHLTGFKDLLEQAG